MTARSHRVGRRELWRARLYGWPERLRRPTVWGPLLAGLGILAGTGWWFVDQTAFARRAISASAVIERVEPPIRVEVQYGPPALVVYGRLRYQVDGDIVHSRVRLANCKTAYCVAVTQNRQGRTAGIAYDPKKVTRVYLGRTVPININPFMMMIAGLGVIFVAAGLYTLFFDLGFPGAKPRDRRPDDGQ
jgi:hypothetical protein